MKFAHVRVSEYFTFAEQIFHSEAISLARRANFVGRPTVKQVLPSEKEKRSTDVFSVVLNGENAATKSSHRPIKRFVGTFIYIGRRNGGERLPPGGSWRRRRLRESA